MEYFEVSDENYHETISKNNWTQFTTEHLSTYDELLEEFDANLKPFGLEIVILRNENYEELYYKIRPRTLLDATKYMVEKGVPIG